MQKKNFCVKNIDPSCDVENVATEENVGYSNEVKLVSVLVGAMVAAKKMGGIDTRAAMLI